MSIRLRNALGILSSEVPTGNLLWVDKVNGVDALAVRGRMTIPFKTLGAARDAAKPDDTIVVLPGEYNANDLLRNGVNWHFMNGARVHYTGSDSRAIFDTGDAAVNASVTGFGEFTHGGSSGGRQVVYCAQANSNLVIHARSMLSESGTCVQVAASAGTVDLCVTGDIHAPLQGVYLTSAATAAVVRVKAHEIHSSTASALYLAGGQVELDAFRLFSSNTNTTDGAIRIESGTALNFIRARELVSTHRRAVLYLVTATPAPKIHIEGARIISGGSGLDGRAVDIQTSDQEFHGNDAVRLSGCVLIASGDYSISAYVQNTRVHVLNGLAVNKATSNVSAVGGEIYPADSGIN